MSNNPTEVVEAFLGALHGSPGPDFETFESVLAPEGYYHTLVPMREKIAGRAAVRAELERQFQLYRVCRCDILNIAANGGVVLTERRDRVMMLASERTGFDHEFEVVVSVCGAFEVRNGLVEGWRDYWDPADIARQVKEALGSPAPAQGEQEAR